MFMPIDALALLQKAKIAILGAGISGHAVAKLLDFLNIKYTLFDEKLGQNLTNQAIGHHDLFIYSPGFRLDHPWIASIQKLKKMCIGEWDLGAMFWKGPKILITGTNGKTTLTEFLAFALASPERKTIALGNNGYPFCKAVLENFSDLNSIAVCEISSYQAENVQKISAQALLWTNIAEDHLDRYLTQEAYFKAKWNLINALNGPFIIGKSVQDFAKQYSLTLPKNTIIAEPNLALIPQNCPFTTIPQQENYALAKAFWENFGLPLDTLEARAQKFSLPPHRLECIAIINGIECWDDSKATNFSSTIAALESFQEKIAWIGGGKSKGGNLDAFCNAIAKKLKYAFLIGETAPLLQKKLQNLGVHSKIYPDLPSLIPSAFKKLIRGDKLLLSPGFSSLDMFKNYEERGKIFKYEVLCLKK